MLASSRVCAIKSALRVHAFRSHLHSNAKSKRSLGEMFIQCFEHFDEDFRIQPAGVWASLSFIRRRVPRGICCGESTLPRECSRSRVRNKFKCRKLPRKSIKQISADIHPSLPPFGLSFKFVSPVPLMLAKLIYLHL
ncbi:MAG: hypothetical protein ACTS4Y_01765 [Candidatus Hodgkinia cicadicola]